MNVVNFPRKSRLHFVFRLDAGTPFGNGHLMRSMVLAVELLERGHEVLLLAQQIPKSMQSMLRHKGIAVQIIAPQSDGLKELAQINQACPVDWLIIDHYGIEAQWESAARSYTSHIMVIDDLANRRHDCDILLDQNVSNRLQQQYDKLLPKNSLQSLGWSYLLARPEFYYQELQERSGMLIFLGGSNHSEVLSILIRSLKSKIEFHPLKIVVSSEYLPSSHWQDLIGGRGRVYRELPDPAPLYRSAKVALVRCGFTSYELALVGTPAVNIHSTEVQFEVAHELENLGIGVAIAEKDLTNVITLHDAIRKLSIMAPEPVNEQLSPGAKKVANLLEGFL